MKHHEAANSSWNVLLIHPEDDFGRTLAKRLSSAFFRLFWAPEPGLAERDFGEQAFHLALVIPGESPMDLSPLWRMGKGNLQGIVLVLTKPEDIFRIENTEDHSRLIVVFEPKSPNQLAFLVESMLGIRRFEGEMNYLRHREPYIYDFERIIANTKAMRHTIDLARKVAQSDATVLIQGETGTGKELLAAAIHYNSPRRGGPFVVVNCSAIHEELLESELFGHEKGAFTGADRQRIGRFEQAHGGTLFLDEVGEMSPRLQAKVLRVIEYKSFERLGGTETIRVDVRILAATNQDLKRAVEEKRFRKDLYYRLNVFPIKIVPLRERRGDIIPLAEFFLARHRTLGGGHVKGIRPEAQKALLSYDWPGNVRELENVIERALVVCKEDMIALEDLMLPLGTSSLMRKLQLPPDGVKLQDVEKDLIIQALERTGWVQRKAARLLGVSPRALHYKIRKHRIPVSKDIKRIDTF